MRGVLGNLIHKAEVHTSKVSFEYVISITRDIMFQTSLNVPQLESISTYAGQMKTITIIVTCLELIHGLNLSFELFLDKAS